MTINGTIETKEIFQDTEEPGVYGGYSILGWLAGAGEQIPAWWSVSRDQKLREFWRSSDHLAGTVNTLREMMITIPFKVLPRDSTIRSHHRQAEEYTRLFLESFESRSNHVSAGWGDGYGPFIEDYLTQDNGAFLAIEGPGRPTGPLTGMPTKLIHLDSGQCWRTGNREFPVAYTDYDGKQYKLHHTRIVNLTSQSGPVNRMCGVGFCAVSRVIHNVQVLMDISRYKQEKLGSRQRRAIIVARGVKQKGVDTIKKQLFIADEQMDSEGYTRFSRSPIIGFDDPTATLELLDLVSLPDGFDEMQSVQLAMAALALAFGVDSRQLAFALGVSGETKADAEVQHLKMRGKGPGTIIQETERGFDAKILPPHLKLVFDFQDDSQDEMQAGIKLKRAERREKDLATGVITPRVAREQMVESGDLTTEQFEQLEIDDGRLEDGTDTLTLFNSNDPFFLDTLNLGVDDPLLISANEPEEMLLTIELAAADLQAILANASLNSERKKTRQALAALTKLQKVYQEVMAGQLVEEEAQAQAEVEQQPEQEPPEQPEGEQPEQETGEEEKELHTKEFNFAARVGETIAGKLARGGGGKFVNVEKLRASLMQRVNARLSSRRRQATEGNALRTLAENPQGIVNRFRRANGLRSQLQRATRPRTARAPRAGGGSSQAEERQSPEERREENIARVRDSLNESNPDIDFNGLAAFANGENIQADQVANLAQSGLIEIDPAGVPRLSSAGRGAMAGARAGDRRRVEDAISRARERANKAKEQMRELQTKATELQQELATLPDGEEKAALQEAIAEAEQKARDVGNRYALGLGTLGVAG